MSFRPAYAISAMGIMGGAAGMYSLRQQKDLTKYGTPRTSQIQVKRGYISEIDFARKQPRWVLQHLKRNDLNPPKPASRTNKHFDTDTDIPAVFQANDNDYTHSGFSRGHMAPSIDNRGSVAALHETFLLNSNVVPQDEINNKGYWAALEHWTRNLMLERKFVSVHVLSGPLYPPMQKIEPDEFKGKDFRRNAKLLRLRDSGIVLEPIPQPSEKDLASIAVKKPLGIVEHPTIGENRVHVPPFLFKAVLAQMKGNSNPYFAAFVIPNAPIPETFNLENFQVTHDELQKISGIEFFQGAFQNATMPPRELCSLSVNSGGAKVPICQLAGEFNQAKKLK